VLFLAFASAANGMPYHQSGRLIRGIGVTDIVDHQSSKSIYFKEPDGLSFEYCCVAAAARRKSRRCRSLSRRAKPHWIRCVLRSIATAHAVIRRRVEAIVDIASPPVSVSLVRWGPSRVDSDQCSQLRNSTQHFLLNPPIDCSLS
jgi:hypothetical protein